MKMVRKVISLETLNDDISETRLLEQGGEALSGVENEVFTPEREILESLVFKERYQEISGVRYFYDELSPFFHEYFDFF